MVAELEIPEIIGQAHLTKRGGLVAKAMESRDCIVFVSEFSAGKSTLLSTLQQTVEATRVSAGLTVTEFKGATQRLPPLNRVITLPRMPTSSTGGSALLDFIDLQGGQVLTEADELSRFDKTLLSRFTVIRLRRLDEADVARIIRANGNNHEWEPDALDIAARAAVGSGGRYAAKLGKLLAYTAPSSHITVEHTREVVDTTDPNPEDPALSTVAKEATSTWIKAMRLGVEHEEDALYWLRVMIDNGVTPSYIARRLLIFAFEDAWSAEAVAVGVGAITLAVHAPRDMESPYWGTSFMCRTPKFWEVPEGRRYEQINQKQALISAAGGTKAPKMREFPSWGLDRHTATGRQKHARGEKVDERFSGHRPGRRHMLAMQKHHGKLDVNIWCPECIAVSLEDKEYLRALGNPMRSW